MGAMRESWSEVRDTGLILAAAVAALCVLGSLFLSTRALLSAYGLQNRIDRSHVLDTASRQLAAALAAGDSERLGEVLRSLIQQPQYAFRYLAVRDAGGAVLAAAGRYESLHRSGLPPAVTRPLRALLYTAFADSGELTLTAQGLPAGSLEYAIGSPAAQQVRDEAVDRLRATGIAGGVLSLLFGIAAYVLLRAAGAGASGLMLARLPPRGEPAAPRPPSPAVPGRGDQAAPEAFDELGLAVLDIDGESRVRAMNVTAATLTGWTMKDAGGQLVYTVFHTV